MNLNFLSYRAYTVSTASRQCLRAEANEGEGVEMLKWKTANCETEAFNAVCVRRDCDPIEIPKSNLTSLK